MSALELNMHFNKQLENSKWIMRMDGHHTKGYCLFSHGTEPELWSRRRLGLTYLKGIGTASAQLVNNYNRINMVEYYLSMDEIITSNCHIQVNENFRNIVLIRKQ